MKNTMYRKAYDTYLGVKNEALAYDFWCKGWDAAVEEIQRKESIAQTNNFPANTETRHYKAFR